MRLKIDNRFHKLEVAMRQVQADIKNIKKMVGKETQDRIEALEEFTTYADNMLTELNHALPDPEYDAKCEAEVAGVEASLDRHRERLGLNKPQLKQLDQSVFDELDEKWRFAARCISGKAIATESEPRIMLNGYYCEGGYLLIGEGYDTSNWQNSLIERDIAKELLEVDLSSELTGSDLARAMLTRGDKYVSGFGHHHSDRLALESKFADTVSKHTQCFQSSQNAWDYFVPINNQGEPLTASEVGL